MLTAAMIDDLVSGAGELALEMVAWPDDRMTAALAELEPQLRASLAAQLGDKIAAIIARCFIRAVRQTRTAYQVDGLHDYGNRLQ